MKVNRREFLQQFGGVLAALGLSEAGWLALASQSQQVLAQPTHRKLALLIGINQYPEAVCDFVPPKGTALNGCLTDVELQQELLLHRFGFQPADILTLTDQQATRSAIEAAFRSHLIEQARSGDVVLFHFSGLGSRVSLDKDATEQQSLVPIDGILPTAENPVVNDLMLETLLLLLRSLPTEQVITILDTGFTPLGRVTQGSLRIRSRPNAPSGQLLAAEQALQSQLLEQLPFSRAKTRGAPPPGLLLTGSGSAQVATEAQWSGFYAGQFTYALTQQLWCSSPATTLDIYLPQKLGQNFAQVRQHSTSSGAINEAINTVPQRVGIDLQPSNSQRINLTAILGSKMTSSTDGFVRSIEDEEKVQLWLGGLPAVVLENIGASLFVVESSQSGSPTAPLLQIRSREGLLAKAKRYSSDPNTPNKMPIKVGQGVQEMMRFLPRNLSLIVGLDASLERVERVDATSAFATIPQVSSVIAGEQTADLLFGKTKLETATLTAALPSTPSEHLTATSTLPFDASVSKRGYSLFALDRSTLYSTLNQDDGAIKTAIQHMTPQLQALLANKLLRLLENHGSSRLGVRATLKTTAPQERMIAQQETTRAPWAAPQPYPHAQATSAPQVTIGSQIQYQILNYSDRPLYWIGLRLGVDGIPTVHFPRLTNNPSSIPQTESAIDPGTTLILLQPDAENLIRSPGGIAETHLILSRSPLIHTIELLNNKLQMNGTQRITNLAYFLDLVQAVLQDLQQIDSPTDSYALNVNQWAAFRFIYEVVST